METIGVKLLSSLKGTFKEETASYLQQNFLTEYSKKEIIARLDLFVQAVETSIHLPCTNDFKLMIRKETSDSETEREYWEISVMDRMS